MDIFFWITFLLIVTIADKKIALMEYAKYKFNPKNIKYLVSFTK